MTACISQSESWILSVFLELKDKCWLEVSDCDDNGKSGRSYLLFWFCFKKGLFQINLKVKIVGVKGQRKGGIKATPSHGNSACPVCKKEFRRDKLKRHLDCYVKYQENLKPLIPNTRDFNKLTGEQQEHTKYFRMGFQAFKLLLFLRSFANILYLSDVCN